MNAELEYYFEQELKFLRRSLVQYAAQNPEAAAKLQISQEGDGYADVERIVHGAALLNARTAAKIDDGHREIIEGFLNVLYPHYLRPLPSMGIAQFDFDEANFQPRIELDRASTRLLVGSGETATFTLPEDMVVLPIRLERLRLAGPPFAVNAERISPRRQVSALQFQLTRAGVEGPLQEVDFGQSLRLFLAEERSDTFELYEFLLRNVSGICFSAPGQDEPFAELPPSALKPVGLDPSSERLLRYEDHSFPGYGLLTELFAYPSRFNFLDLQLPDLTELGEASSLIVTIFLKEQSERLENLLDDDWLRLNCCPIINLFAPDAGTIVEDFDHSSHEIPLVVERVANQQDSQFRTFEDRFEIFSVDSVSLLDCGTQESVELFPLYSVPPTDRAFEGASYYWIRRDFLRSSGGPIIGSDVYLQTTPVIESVERPQHLQYRVEATVMDRAVSLDRNVSVRLAEAVKGVKSIHCIRPLSPAVRPFQASRDLWRIVNHMATNTITLLSKDALQSLLSLYQVFESSRQGGSASQLARAIKSVDAEPSMQRVYVKGRPAFVRGTDIQIGVDPSDLPAGKAYLLGAVLGSFLCGTHSINSFTRVSVHNGSESIGQWTQNGRSSNL